MNSFNLQKGTNLFYHFLGWSIFISYEVALVAIARKMLGLHDPVWKVYLVPYCFNIALFYFHFLFVLNYCFSNHHKRFLMFVFFLVSELYIYLLLMTLIQDTPHKGQTFFLNYPTEVAFIRQLWRGIYFLIFSTAFWLVQRSFRKVNELKEVERKALLEEKEKQRLQLELVSSHNAFLRAQINPHLLFNTLNFIHSEVQEVSAIASNAIITLSDMMRYSLIENKMDGKVELHREVEQIENLIKINQYRFEQKLHLWFHAHGNIEGCRIVPLLLIPFVENLFKYADLSRENHEAVVELKVSDGILEFSTTNRKRKAIAFPSHGIGIENVRTRLQSLYPDRFSLQVEDQDSIFSVYLRINL